MLRIKSDGAPRFATLALAALVAAGQTAAQTKTAPGKTAPAAYSFRNPYYSATNWPIRLVPDAPVAGVKAPQPQDICYPHDPDPAKPGLYMDYRKARAANGYAGFWDDVYVSQDNNHSFMVDAWQGRDGNAVTGIAAGMATATAIGPVALTLGANFTSQSTTGMGHDIANSMAPVIVHEQYFYFANCLRSGPAHISYLDQMPASSADEYQALLPSIYNSVGSSGSEVAALGKLALAAGYLPKDVKRNMKRAGIYPASLLYIWKAALPYDVPYDDELRHRVAYYSTGDHSDYTGVNQTEYNSWYHRYDDNAHMRNMVRIAKSMVYPPPVAILKKVSIDGGQVINDEAKTSWLVHQAPEQEVTIRVSPTDSYDIYGLPLSFRMKMIYGNPKTVITQDPRTQEFTIVVPRTSRLPKGRTTVLLIANNGHFDSNPAAISVYRTSGAENRRPRMRWPADQKLLPGETFSASIPGSDPEGFPVKIRRWSDEVGVLTGDRFEWRIPPGQSQGTYRVHFIATDGTAGNSYESREVAIEVTPAVAELAADRSQGPAPLTVHFDSAGSRDKAGRALTYQWNFDDGSTSTAPNPEHVFAQPGYYRVQLTVTSPSGTDTATTIIHASHDWRAKLRNGWDAKSTDARVWSSMEPHTPAFPAASGNGRVVLSMFDANLPAGQYGLESVVDFSPPLYFEAKYVRGQTEVAGAGFRILDALIGFTPAPGNTMRNEYVAAPDGKGGWTGQFIADRARFSWADSRISLYVTADPNHPGRYRYQGIFVNENGTALIRLDDRPAPTEKKIRLISSEPRTRIDIHEVQAFAPD